VSDLCPVSFFDISDDEVLGSASVELVLRRTLDEID
jgi:hypothetical protein